jgi:DMSO reductase family type II enzyme heme b subunit
VNASIIEAPFGDVGVEELLMPGAEAWEGVDGTPVSLSPTPLSSQPSSYVQVSWEDKPRGDIASVFVKAMHTSDEVAIQLSWSEAAPSRSISDYHVFADACAVLFPENGEHAQLDTMGSADAPVVGWYWRSGSADAFEITARGIGTVERSGQHEVRSAARWVDDQWHVVLLRNLDVSRPHFRNTWEIPIAFAVWRGARSERAGLKSYSPAFQSLRMLTG